MCACVWMSEDNLSPGWFLRLLSLILNLTSWGICLSLPPQHWGYKHVLPCLALKKKSVQGSNLGLHACKANVLLTGASPHPLGLPFKREGSNRWCSRGWPRPQLRSVLGTVATNALSFVSLEKVHQSEGCWALPWILSLWNILARHQVLSNAQNHKLF